MQKIQYKLSFTIIIVLFISTKTTQSELFANTHFISSASIDLNNRAVKFLDEYVDSSLIVSPFLVLSTFCQTNLLNHLASVINSSGLAWGITQKVVEKAEVLRTYTSLISHQQTSTKIDQIIQRVNGRKQLSENMLWMSMQSSLLELQEIRELILRNQKMDQNDESRDKAIQRIEKSISCGVKFAVFDDLARKIVLREFGQEDGDLFWIFGLDAQTLDGEKNALELKRLDSQAGVVTLRAHDELLFVYEGQRGRNLPTNVLDFLMNCYFKLLHHKIANGQDTKVVFGDVRELLKNMIVPFFVYLKKKLSNENLEFEQELEGTDLVLLPEEVSRLTFFDMVKTESLNYSNYRKLEFAFEETLTPRVIEALNPDECNKYLQMCLNILKKNKVLPITKYKEIFRSSDKTSIVTLKLAKSNDLDHQRLLQHLIHNKIQTYDYWFNMKMKKQNPRYVDTDKFEAQQKSERDIDEDEERKVLELARNMSNQIEEHISSLDEQSVYVYDDYKSSRPRLNLEQPDHLYVKSHKRLQRNIDDALPGATTMGNIDNLELGSVFGQLPKHILKTEIKQKIARNKQFHFSQQINTRLKELEIDTSLLEESEKTEPLPSEKMMRLNVDKKLYKNNSMNMRVLESFDGSFSGSQYYNDQFDFSYNSSKTVSPRSNEYYETMNSMEGYDDFRII